jgi:hypothetical protein
MDQLNNILFLKIDRNIYIYMTNPSLIINNSNKSERTYIIKNLKLLPGKMNWGNNREFTPWKLI